MCQCPLGLISHFYSKVGDQTTLWISRCQCPLGLISHFYFGTGASAASWSILCQCPLVLISHFYLALAKYINTHGGRSCQCPLGLISHFYVSHSSVVRYTKSVSMPSRADISFLQKWKNAWPHILQWVSMPSRADISFLRYPFKNLGFMRFPEPVFAGIYQNILTTAFFRAC